jgi:hypothetical protein
MMISTRTQENSMTTPATQEQSSPRGLKALPRSVRFAIAGVILASAIFQARKGILELAPALGLGADPEVAAMSQKASEATRQLLVVFKDVPRKGNPPRQTDATVGPLLATVFDADILKTKTSLGRADIEALGSWGMSAAQAGSMYIFAGTGLTDPEKVSSDPKLVQQANRNVAVYAPEVGRYFDAVLIINGTVADVVADNFSAKANEETKTKDAKAKVQFGVASVIYGVIDSFNIEPISDEWRRGRLLALDHAVPKAAKLLPADQCIELRNLSRSTAASMRDPAVRRGLESVVAALKC